MTSIYPPLDKKTIMTMLQAYQAAHDDVDSIGLFGSFQDDTSTTYSDIDIAIRLAEPISPLQEISALREHRRGLAQLFSPYLRTIDLFNLGAVKTDHIIHQAIIKQLQTV